MFWYGTYEFFIYGVSNHYGFSSFSILLLDPDIFPARKSKEHATHIFLQGELSFEIIVIIIMDIIYLLFILIVDEERKKQKAQDLLILIRCFQHLECQGKIQYKWFHRISFYTQKLR